MGTSHLDNNHVPSLIAVLDTGAAIVAIKADASTHGLIVNDAHTGSDNGPSNSKFDENHTPTLMAVSSADGTTPVVVYGNSSGALLIDSS